MGIGGLPGSRFGYEDDAHAIIVRAGDLLKWAEWPDIGAKPIINPPNTSGGGDWLVWCVYDAEEDAARVVRAELREHYLARRLPTGVGDIKVERDILLEKIIRDTHISHGENLLTLKGEVEISDTEQIYISSITNERST